MNDQDTKQDSPLPTLEAPLKKQLELIAQLSARLGQDGAIREHMSFLARKVCEVLGTDACVIRSLKEDKLFLLGVHGMDRANVHKFIPATDGIAAELIETRKPVKVINAEMHPLTAKLHASGKQNPSHFTFRAYAGAPMIAYGRVTGVLGAYFVDKKVDFDPNFLDLLQILANTAGSALANDRLVSRFNGADPKTRMNISRLLDSDTHFDREPTPIEASPIVEIQNGAMRGDTAWTQIEYDLQSANQQLVMHYQPLWCPVEKRNFGYEALMRWQHPKLGLLMPDQFISMAEESGSILSMGNRAAEDAIGALNGLRRESGDCDCFISINVSVVQLETDDFARHMTRLVTEAGLEPRHVVLEITERSLLQYDSQASRMLGNLADAGFRIFVDDFGAGYSSLSHLIHLPISGIKVDRFFVPDSPGDQRRFALLKTIATMARDLGLTLVVEGVESEFQLEILTEMSVDLIQGHRIAEPRERLG